MSGEMVVGHINWSPDFKSKPDKNGDVWLRIQQALDNGRLKMAPRFEGNNLVSVDIVQAEDDAPDVRPHQKGLPMPVTLVPSDVGAEVQFTYTNWRGVTRERRASFSLLQFGATEYHPEPQLLLYGYDLEKKASRTYAVKDITDLKLI